VQVHRGFEIRPYIEPPETFAALCRALFADAGSGRRFDALAFFEEFNRHIPARAKPDQVPGVDDVLRYYPDVEEADKRFFCGWRDNTAEGKQVTPGNLAKTRRLLGQRAHDFSQRRNHSTRWTHRPEEARGFYWPG
jgi:hypothetical protein